MVKPGTVKTSIAKPWKLTPKQRAAAGYCAHRLTVQTPILPTDVEPPFRAWQIRYRADSVACTRKGKHVEHRSRTGHTW